MADLTNIEKVKLEKFLGMGGGYVMMFSNQTFDELFIDTVGISIYEDKYNWQSGSKANRFRRFWMVEPNHIVSQVLTALATYWKEIIEPQAFPNDTGNQAGYEYCLKVAARLNHELSEHLSAIKPNDDDKSFHQLASLIKDQIEKDEPSAALDRLHTFTTKYVRKLCEKYEIAHDDKPLHGIFGEYVKHLRINNRLQSLMSERILKTNISVFEAFNDVRNNQSFAHDNDLLNYHEAMLIFKNVSACISFIEHLEMSTVLKGKEESEADSTADLSF